MPTPDAAQRRPHAGRRRGSLTVEMIMVVVVLAIATVGIVQFGVFFANAQQVALAARVGALEASQTPNLALTSSGDPVPVNILSAIEHQLQSSRIDWVRVRLEHNLASGGPIVLDSATSGYTYAPKTNLAGPPFAGTYYVRLTVYTPLNDVFPKQLSFFGQQLFPSSKTYEHTVVLRYELPLP
jgi:Flp pilus assembly protein TadG